MTIYKMITTEEINDLLKILKARFEKHTNRHPGVTWESVEESLQINYDKIKIINEMEKSGGEPDIVVFSEKKDELIFVDCAPVTPKGRRSLCYDHEALEKRKEYKPANSAVNMASEMGIELLTENEYRELQSFGEFDLKTSSWVETPVEIRKLGGAIFCDRRYNHVFTYHNGADSYYAVRGFRGKLRI